MRNVLAATLDTPVRVSARDEAGAAGCAMIAAVAIGAYGDMDACIAEWTTPLLGQPEGPKPELVTTYDALFEIYRATRDALPAVWDGLAAQRDGKGAFQ